MSEIENTALETQETTTDAPEAAAGIFTPDMIQKAIESQSGAINEALQAYINAEVQKRIAGVAPKKDTTNSVAVDKAKFEKMSYKERLQLFNASPETYKKLTIGACE